MARILIVDDEPSMRRVLATILKPEEHEPVEADSVQAARAALASGTFDVLLIDQKLPDGEGLSLLVAAREADPSVSVILVTAYATVELAVSAMRCGAVDVVTKPFVPENIVAVVRRASERTELLRENARLRQEVRWLGVSQELVGQSAGMRAVRERIARVAPTEATVLILGETGTGKELVARAIHNSSRRAGKPFVPVNCAALSETLLESELFGHERGAFTGADRARQGLFEAAHHGTLFLDEAGEMPLSLQTKLLRVLMDGQVLRVGATAPRSVDVRIVAATHRDLQQRIRDGRFREDLYYRLAVIPLVIPPLRERWEDIPVLVEHFLKQVAATMGISPRDLAPVAMQKLVRYRFPGNVRELRNLIERAYILGHGSELSAADIVVPTEHSAVGACGTSPPCYQGAEAWVNLLPKKGPLREVLQFVETELIDRAISEAGGVQAEAARRLGVSRSDLTYKLKRRGPDA
jgi:DNA-binding NtrC family response regulator